MTADYTLAEQTPFAFRPGVRVRLMERPVCSWVTFDKLCDHSKNNSVQSSALTLKDKNTERFACIIYLFHFLSCKLHSLLTI